MDQWSVGEQVRGGGGVTDAPLKQRSDVRYFDRDRQAAGEERSGCTEGEGSPGSCPRFAPSPLHRYHDQQCWGGRPPDAVGGPAE